MHKQNFPKITSTPPPPQCYAHQLMSIKGSEILIFRKISRMCYMDDFKVYNSQWKVFLISTTWMLHRKYFWRKKLLWICKFPPTITDSSLLKIRYFYVSKKITQNVQLERVIPAKTMRSLLILKQTFGKRAFEVFKITFLRAAF